MRRRKVISLILIAGTFIYLIASLLALYQNQRVTMEKGIAEALKAYSEEENLEIKELKNDLKLFSKDKENEKSYEGQILQLEGSFSRVEKSIHTMTDGMTGISYNVNIMGEKVRELESIYQTYQKEVEEKITKIEEKLSAIERIEEKTNEIEKVKKEISDMEKEISEIEKEMQEVENKITEIEKMMQNYEISEKENQDFMKEQMEETNKRIEELEKNVLYYQYDSEMNILKMYGKKE